MKKLISLMLLICAVASADVISVRIDAASTNIPSSFSGNNAPILQGVRNMKTIVAFTTAGAQLVLNCSAGVSAAPVDADTHNIYIPATGSVVIDNANLAGNCWVRGDAGTVSTGKLYLMVIGG